MQVKVRTINQEKSKIKFVPLSTHNKISRSLVLSKNIPITTIQALVS